MSRIVWPAFRGLVAVIALAASLPAAGIKMSVLNFEDLATEARYPALGKALSEMALSDLSRVSGLVLVERQDMERVMKELALGLTGATAEETAPKVGRLLGAGYLLAGNYLVAGNKVAISYKLVEVETARIVCAGSFDGKPDDILKLSSSLTSSVAGKLKESFPSLGQMADASASPVPLAEVDRFGQALDLADRGDYTQARSVLKAVVGKHPKFDCGARALNALESRIAEYDRERQRLLDEQRKKPVTWQSFVQLAGSYQSSQQYSSLLAFCQQVGKNPPEPPPGEALSAGELIGFYTVLSLYSLRRWDQVIPEAEKFLKGYPASAYYQSVRGFLAQAMSEIQTMAARLSQAEAEVAPLRQQLEKATAAERSFLRYRMAMAYYGQSLPARALEQFRLVDARRLDRELVQPDLVLYTVFMCYYSLADRAEAARVHRTAQLMYPASGYLASMSAMLPLIPE